MSASLRTSHIPIEFIAAVFVISALLHAYSTLLFWPLIAALLSAIALSIHSPMAVSRRMTFLAHAQAHTILTAALLAALIAAPLGISLSSIAYVLLVLFAAVALNLSVMVVSRLGFREDIATGVVMSFQLSATVALLYTLRALYSASIDPLAVITGEYLFVTWRDVITLAPFITISLLFPLALHRKYLYAALDIHYARAIGIRVGLYDAAFITSMSTAVAGSVYTLGALIPSVLLVLPGAIASRYTLTRQLPASISIALSTTAAAHFLYALLPWLWPTAALGIALLAAFLITKKYI